MVSGNCVNKVLKAGMFSGRPWVFSLLLKIWVTDFYVYLHFFLFSKCQCKLYEECKADMFIRRPWVFSLQRCLLLISVHSCICFLFSQNLIDTQPRYLNLHVFIIMYDFVENAKMYINIDLQQNVMFVYDMHC